VVCHSQFRNGTGQPPVLARQMMLMHRDSAARCIASVLFIRMVLPCSPLLRYCRLFLQTTKLAR
jgi:hypothetical protein